VCIHTHTPKYTPTCIKNKEDTLSLALLKITPNAKRQALYIESDSESFWILDGLSSSSRRRRRDEGRGMGGEWTEKGSAI